MCDSGRPVLAVGAVRCAARPGMLPALLVGHHYQVALGEGVQVRQGLPALGEVTLAVPVRRCRGTPRRPRGREPVVAAAPAGRPVRSSTSGSLCSAGANRPPSREPGGTRRCDAGGMPGTCAAGWWRRAFAQRWM